MSSSTTETPIVRAETVTITGDAISVELSDGRSHGTRVSCTVRLKSSRTGG
jgi:hypothetical protein